MTDSRSSEAIPESPVPPWRKQRFVIALISTPTVSTSCSILGGGDVGCFRVKNPIFFRRFTYPKGYSAYLYKQAEA